MGRRFVWKPGSEVSVSEAPAEFADTAEFHRSTVGHVESTGAPLRRRLADPDCPIDFQVLGELRDEGVTDYLASPFHFTSGQVHVGTWTTRRPGGFTDADIAGLEAVVGPLARVAEIYALRRTAQTLLATYVGSHSAERVMAGRIRRGNVDAIRAAIWLSDMRGFTALADQLPSQMLIDLLNRYFDCQVPAILEHGGEVLKYVGDGLLAIFPLDEEHADASRVCAAALAAARAARDSVAALEAHATVRFAVALHLGDVQYGNIGSSNRLDFTCIGPAVNLAARLEKLAAQLGRTIVASAAFARHCPAPLPGLGEHRLAGFSAPQLVHTVPDEISGA
jgi:adenylate cyclase